MSTCARNLPQHFNGCTCTVDPSITAEATDIDLQAGFASALADSNGFLDSIGAPAAPEPDPVLEEWRNTPGFVVMFEDLPPGTPQGWSGASVMSANGTRWNLRFIPQGAPMGHAYAKPAPQDMIGFYDAGHVTEDWPHGQKVADYYVDTLMPANGPSVASGLNLHGGVPEWQIDAESMRGVLGWTDMTRSAQEPKGPKRHTWSDDPNLVKPPKAAVSLVTDAEDAGMKVDVIHDTHNVTVSIENDRNSASVTWTKGDYYDEPDRGKLPFRTGGTPTKGVRFYMANGHIRGEYPNVRSARQARLYIGLPEK